jgi:uncharacterized membrane protein
MFPSLLKTAIWLQNTPLFIFIREADYGYFTTLAFHLTCISLFAGMIVMTDLRLLGIGLTKYSVADVVNQMRVPKRIGFVLAVTCGFLVFGTKAEEYYYNGFFRAKLVLFVLVGVHALIFRRSIYKHPEELDKFSSPPTSAKAAAMLSLVLWLCIVMAGRGIGYIHPPPLSHHFVWLR